jgi:hypothetical protein
VGPNLTWLCPYQRDIRNRGRHRQGAHHVGDKGRERLGRCMHKQGSTKGCHQSPDAKAEGWILPPSLQRISWCLDLEFPSSRALRQNLLSKIARLWYFVMVALVKLHNGCQIPPQGAHCHTLRQRPTGSSEEQELLKVEYAVYHGSLGAHS